MVPLALIHLFWLTLTPVGGALLLMRRRLPKGLEAISAMAALTGLLGWFFLLFIWPFDFVGPVSVKRVQASSPDWALELRQQRGVEGIYATTLAVRRLRDDRATVLLIEEDDLKLWRPRVRVERGVVRFARLGGGWYAPEVLVDLATGAILVPGKAQRHDLDDLFPDDDDASPADDATPAHDDGHGAAATSTRPPDPLHDDLTTAS